MIYRQKRGKMKAFIKKNLKWFILLIGLIIFLELAEDVFSKEILKADMIGYELISSFLISDFATPIAKFITNFGGVLVLVVTTIILFIIIKNKKIGLSIFANLCMITGLNVLLKQIVQ